AITSIGLDHTDLLGGTLREIAREKAGIARPGVPLYLGPLPPEAAEEIARIAAQVGAPVRRWGSDLAPPATAPALLGPHQGSNAALAVALAEAAAAACRRPLAPGHVAEGLRRVQWPGRL